MKKDYPFIDQIINYKSATIPVSYLNPIYSFFKIWFRLLKWKDLLILFVLIQCKLIICSQKLCKGHCLRISHRPDN